MVTYRSDLQPGGGMSTPLIERSAGNVVIPGSDELSMELLKQMFGIGVGPEEAKRKMKMREGISTGEHSNRGNMGDYMGSKRKAFQGEGQAPSTYDSAVNQLNDMLYMTGGYINPQRNMGDLWKAYHGFV